MKVFILLAALVLPFTSFAQGWIPTNCDSIPGVLRLQALVPYSGDVSFRHLEDNSISPVLFSPRLSSFQQFLQTNLGRGEELVCTGNFTRQNDGRGCANLVVNSIRLCLNREGLPVANQLETGPISQNDLNRELLLLSRNVQPLNTGWIYNNDRSAESLITRDAVQLQRNGGNQE